MRTFIFRASDEETDYIDKNGGITAYLRNRLEKDMNNKKYETTEKIQLPFMMILIGLFLLIIGVSNVFNEYILLFSYGMSIFSISFGIFSIIGVVKRNA